MCFSLTIHHFDTRSTTKTLAAPHSWVVCMWVWARALSKPIEEKAIETETTKRANRQYWHWLKMNWIHISVASQLPRAQQNKRNENEIKEQSNDWNCNNSKRNTQTHTHIHSQYAINNSFSSSCVQKESVCEWFFFFIVMYGSLCAFLLRFRHILRIVKMWNISYTFKRATWKVNVLFKENVHICWNESGSAAERSGWCEML